MYKRNLTSANFRKALPLSRFLSLLSDEDFQRLRPHLKTVSIRARQVLFKAGDRLNQVYFLNGGVCSLTITLSDGAIIEATTVGDEGIVGVEALLTDDETALSEAIMQVPDTNAEVLAVDQLRREVGDIPALEMLVRRYARTVIAQMMQTTACNVHHDVHQRCASWLLMTHDRMHGGDFRLSHEFLAEMLGASRQTVNTVARLFKAAGFMDYSHGRITILDRKGLEQSACECYGLMRAQFDHLLQPLKT
jgi:CRP-like cAMP-binding protein